MSAVEKYMKMIDEEEVSKKDSSKEIKSERKSFQEIRTEVINYLRAHLWVMKKECEYLDNRTDANTESNFNEKGKGWAWVIKGTEILDRKY